LFVGANLDLESLELTLEIVPLGDQCDSAAGAGNFARRAFVLEELALGVFEDLLEALLLAEPHDFLRHSHSPRAIGKGVFAVAANLRNRGR
jgi:hypothetical protein